MSQVRNADADARRALARLMAPIAGEMAEVERRLQQELRHPDAFIDELARHSFRLGGKRLRPALVLLAARTVGDITPDHRALAAVVEMIHTATLIHDDILDDAQVRRHRDTVNARWNNQTSVLLGDYLFTHAFTLAAALDTNYACRALGDATSKVCVGELRQTASSGDFWLSLKDYLAIVEAKTAELCACCCRLGAHYAGGDETAARTLATYGLQLGIAFQIADDLLDLEGDESVTGKSLGTDLANRKMTLPLILLRDGLPPAEAARLHGLFEEADAEHAALVFDWLEEAGALSQARRIAGEYGDRALAALADLPESHAKQTLTEIARFVVAREA